VQVFLIRHPQPLIAAGICYGRLDVDCVDPLPIAAHLRPRIPAGTPVFTSPLRRARQLAEAIAPDAVIDDRLAEIDFGAWEGRAWDDIERHALDAWAADVRGFVPPGGESVAQLQARAVDFAGTIDSLGVENVALVAHAGILRALAGYWRQLPFAEWTQLQFDFGSLTEITTSTNNLP
jgi:alpha-ribazole phosphatase